MSARLSERAIYERKRRGNVMKESREHRVMKQWLAKAAEEFTLFHGKLQRENPNSKNLTTTGDFTRFMRLGKGAVCVSF